MHFGLLLKHTCDCVHLKYECHDKSETHKSSHICNQVWKPVSLSYAGSSFQGRPDGIAYKSGTCLLETLAKGHKQTANHSTDCLGSLLFNTYKSWEKYECIDCPSFSTKHDHRWYSDRAEIWRFAALKVDLFPRKWHRCYSDRIVTISKIIDHHKTDEAWYACWYADGKDWVIREHLGKNQWRDWYVEACANHLSQHLHVE